MSTEVRSPLPGKIIRLSVTPGQSIEEDTEVMVIEAMKMETPVYAPCGGVIDKLTRKEGDEVEEDDLIAVIS